MGFTRSRGVEMGEHTPTPWAAQEPDPSDGVAIVGLRTDRNGDPYDTPTNGIVALAIMLPTELDIGDTARASANAAFIVRACNSHEALISALEDARSFMVEMRARHGDSGVGILIRHADAALAAAKGEA